MKTPKTIEKRNALAKALKSCFGYDLADTDKVRYFHRYSDRQIVDIEIEREDGLYGYADAYDMRHGCFPYDVNGVEVG